MGMQTPPDADHGRGGLLSARTIGVGAVPRLADALARGFIAQPSYNPGGARRRLLPAPVCLWWTCAWAAQDIDTALRPLAPEGFAVGALSAIPQGARVPALAAAVAVSS